MILQKLDGVAPLITDPRTNSTSFSLRKKKERKEKEEKERKKKEEEKNIYKYNIPNLINTFFCEM